MPLLRIQKDLKTLKPKNYFPIIESGILKNLTYAQTTLDFAFGVNHQLIAIKNSKSLFKIIDQNTYSINGSFITKIEVKGIPIGVLVNQIFYPTLINHQNAIVGLLNNQGEIILKRDYTISGELKSEFSKKGYEDLAELVLFGYGKLYHLPFIERSSALYASQTRILDTTKGKWLTADELILNNPQYMIKNPGNWKIYEYASGDPLNFIDPSGHFAVSTGLLLAGVYNAAAMGSAWPISKGAMWLGNSNTPQNNANLNKGLGIGAVMGFGPAAIVGGGQMMMGVGRLGYKGLDIAAKATYMTSPTWFNRGMDMVSGFAAPSVLSNKWQIAGWGADNFDNITSSFERSFDSISNFPSSFDSRGYQDYGFRFYDNSPSSNDQYSFGTWAF